MNLAIIIPVLNEAAGLEACVKSLQLARRDGAELIIVDGGSVDDTLPLAQDLKARGLIDIVISAPKGRATQMNAGAARATADHLLFLHADTQLPDQAGPLIKAALADPSRLWGRFDVMISGTHWFLPIIAFCINLRSRWSGIATGDQALFMIRAAFDKVGGFANLPLMEDIVLSKALKRLSPPVCLREHVRTSDRRWEKHGVFKVIILMWSLRLAFFCGVDPHRLAKAYGYE
jgi:rSAM/selenodomain-associated transferase 2